jgi:uncharacterized coiled-coil protein SlyX
MGGEGMITLSPAQASKLVINKLLGNSEKNINELLYEEYLKNPDITNDEVLEILQKNGFNLTGASRTIPSKIVNAFRTREDISVKKGFRSGATALKAVKTGKNTYTIEKVGDTVFFVIDKNGKVIKKHGLSDIATTQGYMFSVRDGKPYVSNPKTDNFTVALNEGETLVLATDFIETDKAIQDFINSDFGKNLDFAKFQKENKTDDSTFITIKYDAELAALEATAELAALEATTDTTDDIKAKKAEIEKRARIADIITTQLELGTDLPKILDTLAEQGYVEKINGNSFFEQTAKRDAIVFNIDGAIVPIYRSSKGTSSKTKGKWYPFFFNGGDWLVKAGADTYKDGYNNPIIKQIVNSLNKNYKYEKPIAKAEGNNEQLLSLLGLKELNTSFENNNGIYDYRNYIAIAIVLKDWQSKLGNIDVTGYQDYLDGVSSRLIEANPTLKSEIEKEFKIASDNFAELDSLEEAIETKEGLTETEEMLLEQYKTALEEETERINKGEGNPDIQIGLEERIAELESRLSVEEQVESTIEIDKAIEELKAELESLNIKIKGTAPTFEYKQSVETVDDGFTLAFNKYSNAKSDRGKKAAREELIEKYGEKRVARYEAIDSNFNDIVKGIIASGINIFSDSEEGIKLRRCK